MDRAQTQFDEHLRNFTDILQVKFPEVKFDDIPHEGDTNTVSFTPDCRSLDWLFSLLL
jgi:hypothetical protein